ncbi:unnamed protein product [Mycena citricolor]|uniref:Uncharacterized protein n=1 Tax=Mycena citricolor TaxID=2018698 RepID=A0AAD2HDS0_9AGAR|nr:unnamed protein product [Mycena citricolor]
MLRLVHTGNHGRTERTSRRRRLESDCHHQSPSRMLPYRSNCSLLRESTRLQNRHSAQPFAVRRPCHVRSLPVAVRQLEGMTHMTEWRICVASIDWKFCVAPIRRPDPAIDVLQFQAARMTTKVAPAPRSSMQHAPSRARRASALVIFMFTERMIAQSSVSATLVEETKKTRRRSHLRLATRAPRNSSCRANRPVECTENDSGARMHLCIRGTGSAFLPLLAAGAKFMSKAFRRLSGLSAKDHWDNSALCDYCARPIHVPCSPPFPVEVSPLPNYYAWLVTGLALPANCLGRLRRL